MVACRRPGAICSYHTGKVSSSPTHVMSLKVIKHGTLDTIQDLGRYGFQFMGINPGGVMDVVAAQAANMLVGNSVAEAVIELHFPAAAILFEHDALIALSGGDFEAVLNDCFIPLNTPVIVTKYSVLQFTKYNRGARCYLAVHGGFNLP